MTKNKMCKDWYAHVKSDRKSLLTYAPPKAAHAVYSVNIGSAQAENREILV